ncbi:MAG TPA: phosphoribosylglycinamide formyltransferase [Clostridiales bacterium]|jgi:phosphoribosylglycinamide formyltransferase-1|nr:phosphoribosylglycinamide formyltransferase [Clostridiales bacterium]
MVKTAVLVSGGGTNLQAIIDSYVSGKIPNCRLAAVVSSNPLAYALKRAEKAGIPGHVVDVNLYPDRGSFCGAILDKLRELSIELVVLAGFMYILDPAIISHYRNRIINIHPALIPSFSGPGCYGLHVHEMALKMGVKITGATAHFVSEDVDAGPIILQKAVEVREGDTPRTLQRRVMEEAEWKILPQAIALYCSGRLKVDGHIVRIMEE